MRGRIIAAVNVRGERPGQTIQRRWTFSGLACGRYLCPHLRLRRERADHLFSTLILSRQSDGTYAGGSTFPVALSCLGTSYPYGAIAPYRITVRVIRATRVQRVSFARTLSATYENPGRSDQTPCPLGPSLDAAVYSGTAASAVAPPRARLSVRRAPGLTAMFADASQRGAGGAAIVSRRWTFGDRRSRSADSSRQRRPRHTYAVAGTYTVSLAVIDANGLHAAIASRIQVATRSPAEVDRREHR